jgi:hypothetical protein
MLALCIGSISTSAFAASWAPVGNAVLRRYFVDTKSITAPEIDPVRTWIKIDYKRDPAAKFDHALGVWEFRCQTREMRIASRTTYAKSGALIETEQFTEAQFSSIVPGSIEQAVETMVCARSKRPPAADRR